MSYERIYLQLAPADDEPGDGSTWCVDRITDEDVEYVRADLFAAAQAEAREEKTRRIRAHIQLSNAQAEARELRAETRDWKEHALAEQRHREQIAQERNELRAELAQVRKVVDELADLMQGVIDGDYKPDSFTLQPYRALSPAPEQRDRLATCPGCNKSVADCGCGYLAWEQPAAPAPELPLMAEATFVRLYDQLDITDHPIVELGGQRFRIADTDEHGLPVIPREKGMPSWAKYRFESTLGGNSWFTYESGYHVGCEERIEDFTPAAQESGDA